MNAAVKQHQVPASAPLAVAGLETLIEERKRKLHGHPWWKQSIFFLTRKWLTFCDVVLKLPVIIHHDHRGDFWIDYCGVFDTSDLAIRAVEKMIEDRFASGHSDSQFIAQPVTHNAVTPEKSSRYYDSQIEGEGPRSVQDGQVKTEIGDESYHAAVETIAELSTRVVNQARKLNRHPPA
jgi:hypothetical protein